jgi:aminocarboxymuconate-semialdehyde decarboxylase
VRYINEEIARLAATAPDRFSALGGVPLQDTDAAIEELEYVTGELGFAGVEIASHVNGVSIGDARFEPFFARAATLGAAVFVHALRPAGKERLVGAFPEQAVCFPGDIALAAASMITGGVAARHPSLRIAFSHGGGALAMLLPRLVQAWKVVPKARESLAESPEVYARRFFYDTLVFSPAALQFLVASMGASQVLVGTDFPFGLGDGDPVASLQAAGFDEATMAALLHGNARRFLNLETRP